jgi:hypothetical protein
MVLRYFEWIGQKKGCAFFLKPLNALAVVDCGGRDTAFVRCSNPKMTRVLQESRGRRESSVALRLPPQSKTGRQF